MGFVVEVITGLGCCGGFGGDWDIYLVLFGGQIRGGGRSGPPK